ncbi:PilW family protein [Aquabacterium sp.]|uniref:PilW family protein n=1 Tax=Aquabacterium sp. TaxID=1872578 RepID=UPI003D6CA0FF
MRPTPRSSTAHQRGFTLIEMIMAIVITGIIGGIVAVFMVNPIKGYFSTAARAGMVDNADLALRRMGRDLRSAVPNSVRVAPGNLAVEFIPLTSVARYYTEGSGKLEFGVTDTSFDIIGPGLTLTASQNLVFYNLGPSVTDADAYASNSSALAQASSNRRTSTNGAGIFTTITMSSLAGLPVNDMAPPYRVYAVNQPVTYRCDLAAGTLTRYWNYGFQASQPDPPTGATTALVAKGVTGCTFSYDSSVVATRAGLVTMRLTLAAPPTGGSAESVSLYHVVHVSNLP